jgi:hypothetical protein
MSRLHRRVSVSFSHPSLFIPNPDEWDKYVNETIFCAARQKIVSNLLRSKSP